MTQPGETREESPPLDAMWTARAAVRMTPLERAPVFKQTNTETPLSRPKLRAAIDAKCKDCIYDPECGGGTWREQVAQCSSISCPIWPFRAAPGSGPLADPPRDPATVSREWLQTALGSAVKPCPSTDRDAGGPRPPGGPT